MVNIPSFDSFIDEVGADTIGKLSEESALQLEGEYNLLTGEGLTKYTVAVLSCSSQFSVKLLELYHEWLQNHA